MVLGFLPLVAATTFPVFFLVVETDFGIRFQSTGTAFAKAREWNWQCLGLITP